MPQPDFKHRSWDTTFWSLWGLLYTGAESDRALQTALSLRFDEAVDLLSQIGPQAEPMQSRVQEWKDEVATYGRTITFGEANEVLARLSALVVEIRQQLERDRALAKAGAKPAPIRKKQRRRKAAQAASPVAEAVDEDEDGPSADDIEWATRAAHTVMGHSAATAQSRPQVVKPKARPYVPPTPEEIWRGEQRSMANRCDNGINFGAHDVDQGSVLVCLHLAPGDGGVRQYRPGPEGGHERIMATRNGVQYWTLGLSHRERRDAGRYSVYRRVGASSRFEHVSGLRHPKDPG